MPATSRSGEVGAHALGHGPQRLALEVQQHPAAPGHLEHLPEVVVAVDALQRRPGDLERARRRPPRSPRAARRSRAPRRSRSPAGAARSPRSPRGRRAASRASGTARRATTCTSAVAAPERVRAVAEVLAAGGGAQSDAPRVLDARAGTPARTPASPSPCPAAVARSGHAPSIEPIAVRHVRRPGVGERGLQLDVGVEPGMQLAEHLADDRHRAVVGAVDERGVRLLAGQHRGRARRLATGDAARRVPGGDGARARALARRR